MKHLSFVIVLIAVIYLKAGSCLYFHIGETERKCFIEEIPDETPVIGEGCLPYHLEGNPSPPSQVVVIDTLVIVNYIFS